MHRYISGNERRTPYFSHHVNHIIFLFLNCAYPLFNIKIFQGFLLHTSSSHGIGEPIWIHIGHSAL